MATNNAINTPEIVLGGPLTFSGAHSFTGTITADTTVTFPTSGTLATTAGASGVVNSSTANNLTYYAGTGTTVSGLSTSNDAVLTTNGSGAPTWVPLTSNGQILIGSGSGAPAAATLTQGTGITITNAANSITIAATGGGGGFTWNTASGTTQAAAINNGYVCTNASVCTVTLPATAAVGSVVSVQGAGSTSGWILAPNSGQNIQVGQTNGTASVTAAAQYDSISVVCIVANTTWAVTSVLSSGVTVA